MKSVAALAVAAALLAGSALTSTAASHSGATPHSGYNPGSLRAVRWLAPEGLPFARAMQIQSVSGADQAADSGTPTDTPTPTATASPSPTPTATSTTTGLPDPTTLLTAMSSALAIVKTVHFQENSVDHQPGGVDLTVKDSGDSTCTGFAVKAHAVVGADVAGTTQSETDTYDLIRIKKKDYWKDKKHTKGTWQPTKDSSTFPFTAVVMSAVDNPLSCFASLATSTSDVSDATSCSDQPSDLTNAGEMTFNHVDVYDIHYTDVQLCSNSSQPTETPVDLYVGKAHPLLYGTLVKFDYRQNGVGEYGQVTQKFSKYGEKFRQKAPKTGSKTP